MLSILSHPFFRINKNIIFYYHDPLDCQQQRHAILPSTAEQWILKWIRWKWIYLSKSFNLIWIDHFCMWIYFEHYKVIERCHLLSRFIRLWSTRLVPLLIGRKYSKNCLRALTRQVMVENSANLNFKIYVIKSQNHEKLKLLSFTFTHLWISSRMILHGKLMFKFIVQSLFRYWINNLDKNILHNFMKFNVSIYFEKQISSNNLTLGQSKVARLHLNSNINLLRNISNDMQNV